METNVLNDLFIVLGFFLVFLVIVIILCLINDDYKYNDLQRRLKEERERKRVNQ